MNINESDINDANTDSDDELKIDLKLTPKKRSKQRLNSNDMEIINSCQDNIENTLDEKAAKSNLTAVNVKNILKQVLTNEHVLAMVQASEHDEHDMSSTFEPKLTRSKAKELQTTSSVGGISWQNSKPTSEVQVLFQEELQEDSSGDEYIPAEEESEDDKDSSLVLSDAPSPYTPTTIKIGDVEYSQDGIFKVPKPQEVEETNIALRTRSKLCLSSTPLEVIEEAFIPPDITTDMYDMDCNDGEWIDFLKTFTRPLDELVKAPEDEELDPEYNILADEEIDKVDKEELREDRAVKITRKELNNLMSELFEYSDIYDYGEPSLVVPAPPEAPPKKEISFNTSTINTSIMNITQSPNNSTENSTLQNSIFLDTVKNTTLQPELSISTESSHVYNPIFSSHQIVLLEQQIRQHIQMLTQNFLLTYEHPEFDNCPKTFKEYIMNFKYLSDGKQYSMFRAINLKGALDLITRWENMFASGSENALNIRRHFQSTLEEAYTKIDKGFEVYCLPFPPFIMKTISESNVFLYPNLLPRTPFKTDKILNSDKMNKVTFFSKSEEQLIALGLEQFTPFLAADKSNLNKAGTVGLKHLAIKIHTYLLPSRCWSKIYRRIMCRKDRYGDNPIHYYYKYNKAPATIHDVTLFSSGTLLPPCKRRPEELPKLWREFNFPNETFPAPVITNPNLGVSKCNGQTALTTEKPSPSTKKGKYSKTLKKSSKQSLVTSTPLVRKVKSFRKRTPPSKLSNLDKSIYYATLRLVEIIEKPVPLSKLADLTSSAVDRLISSQSTDSEEENMLPSMPNLLTPIKENEKKDTNDCNSQNLFGSISDIMNDTINSTVMDVSDTENDTIKVEQRLESEAKASNDSENLNLSQIDSENDFKVEHGPSEVKVDKDNLDDINALMIASSTVLKTNKKDNSAAEKKKAKLRKEQLSNLSIVAPLDPATEREKRESFAQSYFEKLRDTLELEDFTKVMEIFNNQDLITGDVVDLYKKISPILSTKYTDMADEFLLFLSHEQAAKVGKLIPYYIMNNMSRFLQKLEQFFKDQPYQVRKICRSLVELNDMGNVSLEKMKSTMLPLLKGNMLLTDWFLQIFLEERPPPILLRDKWEEIDVNKELSKMEDYPSYENFVTSESEDPFGGITCACLCHKSEEGLTQPQSKQHCTKCGLRFIQGKVYVQTAKGLHPANVTFPSNPNANHSLRLNAKVSKKKRSDTFSSKRVTSPTKESHEEHSRANNESEEDDKKKRARATKSPRKTILKQDKSFSKTKEQKCKKACAGKTLLKSKGKTEKGEKETCEKTDKTEINNTAVVETEVLKPETNFGQKRCADEIEIDWNAEPPADYIKLCMDSESQSCDDLSQDNSDFSEHEFVELTKAPDGNTWTRDEDKIILETFQQKSNQTSAFQEIALLLKNRSIKDIESRFQALMILLQEMASNSS